MRSLVENVGIEIILTVLVLAVTFTFAGTEPLLAAGVTAYAVAICEGCLRLAWSGHPKLEAPDVRVLSIAAVLSLVFAIPAIGIAASVFDSDDLFGEPLFYVVFVALILVTTFRVFNQKAFEEILSR